MTQARKVHIVGAGMAGLAAAVRCIELGLQVSLNEGAPQAGGRCRSFDDAAMGTVIDNGNHLILGANPAIFSHLRAIGAQGSLTPLDPPRFPFIDVTTGARWTVRPGMGRLPWWLLVPGRSVPGAGLADYAAVLRLLNAPGSARLADYVKPGTAMFARFWEPFALGVMNTEAKDASAFLIGRVLRETLLKGGAASRPYFAEAGLGTALVDPAVTFLEDKGASVAFSRRLRALEMSGDRVSRMAFADDTVEVQGDDMVILAVPSWEAGNFVPGLSVPTQTRPIVNAHFRIEGDFALPGAAPFVGVIGGTAQWLFRRGPIVSATVSAAVDLVDAPAGEVAQAIWSDIARAIGRPAAPMPVHRIIKEKRATIAQTPADDARRPPAATRWRNLLLAGDWTQTGLPATIEGAVRSGHFAAEMAANSARR
jgi:squalene-associated FAD-dependent desaturase